MLIFFLLSVSFLSVTMANAINIGVSPSRLKFQSILQSGYAEKEVTISTTSDDELTAHFEITGEISDWLRFEPNETYFVVSSSNPYRLKVIAEPPSDAGNGTHSGMVTFVTDRVGNLTSRAGGVVKVAVGLGVDIDITTEKISSCLAGGFNLRDTEVNYPIELSMSISNTGNLRITPILSVDIWDQAQEDLVITREIQGEEILPTTNKEIKRAISGNLAVGQYWASIEAKNCGKSDLLTFSVVEKGSLIDRGELTKLSSKVWAFVGEPVQITAEFHNTGERNVFARFKGTITLDEQVVKVIDTEELQIPPGESVDFTDFFTPKSPGRYVISGKVIYNKKFTYEKGTILNVNPATETKNETNYEKAILLLIYLVVIITIIFIARKIIIERRRKRMQ